MRSRRLKVREEAAIQERVALGVEDHQVLPQDPLPIEDRRDGRIRLILRVAHDREGSLSHVAVQLHLDAPDARLTVEVLLLVDDGPDLVRARIPAGGRDVGKYFGTPPSGSGP